MVRKGNRGAAALAFQFVVALRGARPRVWRRVVVRGDTLLSELHDVLQVVTGLDAELHTFSLPGGRPRSDCYVPDADECQVRLADVARQGTRLHYECTGDDCWRYRLDVESVRPVETDMGYPVCLAGRSPSPGARTTAGFDLGRVNQRLAGFQRLPGSEPARAIPTIRDRQLVHEVLSSIAQELPRAGAGRRAGAKLRAGLTGLSPGAVQSELLELIEKQSDVFATRLLVVDAFIEIGLGDAVHRLQALASDVTRPLCIRGLCFEVLSLLEPTATAHVLGALPPPERDLMLREQFGSLFVAAQVDPDAASLIAQTLVDQVALGDREFVGFLERCRMHVGVPAGIAYSEALRSPALTPIRSRLLDILVSAGGSQVASLLVRVRDETLDPVWKRRLQRAVLQVLTDVIEIRPRQPGVIGRAWSSCIDGLGCFSMFAHVQAPGARCLARVDGCVEGGFHDAELLPRASSEDVRHRLSSFVAESGRLVEVPIDEAAARVSLVARRTLGRGLEVPRHVAASVELIESAWTRASGASLMDARR